MVLRSSLAVDNRRADQTVQPNNGSNLPGEAYDRFVGRYSMPLAVQFAAFAEVGPSSQVLDVGCGPGALTGELVRLVGAENVLACDPSEPFVAACAARHPGVDVRLGTAEQVPFGDDSADAALLPRDQQIASAST